MTLQQIEVTLSSDFLFPPANPGNFHIANVKASIIYCADNNYNDHRQHLTVTANYQFQESIEYEYTLHVLFSVIHNINTTIVSISCTYLPVTDPEIKKGWFLKENEPVGRV